MSRKVYAILLAVLVPAAAACAQTQPPTDPAVIATIHRLLLTDGSYQQVRHWEIRGDRVRYLPADRGGWEELPIGMVDWAATEKFAYQHTEQGREASAASADARAIDAEAAAEKAETSSRTPQVAPHLHLPDRDGVWVLDYFQNQPELVTLTQDSGNVNRQPGAQCAARTNRSPPNRKVELRLDGEGSKIHLHGNQPVFYVSLTGGDDSVGSDALTVSTPETKTDAPVSSPKSQYEVVEVDQRRNYRVITNETLRQVGHQDANVTETTTTVLPGAHWMKVVPKQKLTIGQYALMEILGPHEANLAVWDFAIEPQSGDNANAILPME